MNISDGQHQHSNERATIEISWSGVKIMKDHLKASERCMPLDPSPDSKLPFKLEYELGKTSGLATIICGICKKEIGSCDVKKLSKPKKSK